MSVWIYKNDQNDLIIYDLIIRDYLSFDSYSQGCFYGELLFAIFLLTIL
jgi:hypothetical protein